MPTTNMQPLAGLNIWADMIQPILWHAQSARGAVMRHAASSLWVGLPSSHRQREKPGYLGYMVLVSGAKLNPSPPGVHPLPQRRQRAGPQTQEYPRHRRQLCHPQASQGARMADPASSLDVPLHSNLGVLAQRRRRLLRQAHKPTPQARRVHLRRRPQGRHQPLRRRNQLPPQTLRVDCRSQTRARRCQTREASVRVGPLGSRISGCTTKRVGASEQSIK